MFDALFVLPIVVVIIVFAAAPLINMFKNTFGDSSSPTQNHQKDAKFNRQVHQMHAKDASSERKHYLDQLKSLYDAGMMERDEYNERVAAVEAEYRGKI